MRNRQEQAQREAEDPLKDSLVCSQELPLRWRKPEHALTDNHRMLIYNDNQKLMEVLLGGEETLEVEQQRDKEIYKEIRRLDAKLSLMMDWFGQIIGRQQPIPATYSVSLSSKGMQFYVDVSSGAVISKNDELFMELFLEPRYPQPFVVLAKVIHVDSQNEKWKLSVRFIHLSEQCQQWLDKYVFRLHRRQVALTRKGHTTLR